MRRPTSLHRTTARRPLLLLVVFLALAFARGAQASVADSGPGGFTISDTVRVDASAADAYRRFSIGISEWWNPEHTYSGKSANLSIDARPNGCFCEELGEGAGVVHMTVVFAQPGQMLRMTGGLGPLQGMGASGAMTVRFAKEGEKTRVEFTYAVGGYFPMGAEKLAPIVDAVLTNQWQRFGRFANGAKP